MVFAPAGSEEGSGGRAPDLARQARIGNGRYHQVAPASVSDAQVLVPPGVQLWAQLANVPPLQISQHVPALAILAAVSDPSLAVPAAVPAAVSALGGFPLTLCAESGGALRQSANVELDVREPPLPAPAGISNKT